MDVMALAGQIGAKYSRGKLTDIAQNLSRMQTYPNKALTEAYAWRNRTSVGITKVNRCNIILFALY